MQKMPTLTKSIIMVLSIATVSTTAVAVGQGAMKQTDISDAVAAVQSKVSLEQAMAIAKRTVQGDVISAEFDQYDRSAGGDYEVNIIANNTEYEIKVDANSGKAMTKKQERLDNEDVAEYNAMKKSKISLNQAITTANQRVNGTVIEAGFDVEAGKSVYEIEMVKGTQVHKAVIDGMTGQIVSSQVEAADDD